MKFYKIASHFTPILCNRGTWNFFCILTHMDTLCTPNFVLLGCTVFREKCDDTLKIPSHVSSMLSDQGTWNFFCILTHMDTLCKQNFDVPRSQSFREKCDDNLKLAMHFSEILCDRGTWSFFCILTFINTVCKPNLMFLCRTVFEKNEIITWNLHPTFFQYCVTEELEIYFVY